jgi:hypothetical protein
MRNIIHAFLVLLIVVAPVCVHAQPTQGQPTQQQPPSQPGQPPLPRPYRGLFGGGQQPDPNRSRHELTLTLDTLAGYDDILAPTGVDPVASATAESGYTVFGEGNLRYWYGRTGRSISADGRVFSNAYTTIDVGTLVGGNGQVRVETPLGRRSSLTASQSVRYEPSLVLGAFGPLQSDVDQNLLPETGQSNGYVDQRSWSLLTDVGAERRWTPRQMTRATFGYSQQTYLDELGHSSTGMSASIGHESVTSRNTSLLSTYRFTDSTFEGAPGSGGAPAVAGMPLTDHTFEFGGSYTRRLSPTRQLTFSGGGGATYVQTLSTLDRSALDYWTPSGYGSVSMAVGRTWSVVGNYRRGATVLQGVTLQSFATDAFHLGVDGSLSRRIDVYFGASYSNGQAGGGEQLSRFASYDALAQMRYALARCCALSVHYYYYYYRLDDITDVPTGVPDQFDRNAIRIGFTFWLPLYGSYTDGPERARRGGNR